MDHELREPLGELRQAGRGVQVVEAEQVDDDEDAPKASRIALVRGSRGRETSDERSDEPEREQVGERELPPKLQCTFSKVQQKSVARKKKLVTRLMPPAPPRGCGRGRRAPARACDGRPSSATRGESGDGSRVPVAPAVAQGAQLPLHPVDVVGRDDDAGARLADQLGRGAVRRHDGQDRPARGQVLEHLPGEDAAPAAARLRDQEQQRLGVALQLERPPVRRVRDQLDPVDDPLRPLAVGGAEVADEARHARRRRARARSGTASGRACRRTSRRG